MFYLIQSYVSFHSHRTIYLLLVFELLLVSCLHLMLVVAVLTTLYFFLCFFLLSSILFAIISSGVSACCDPGSCSAGWLFLHWFRLVLGVLVFGGGGWRSVGQLRCGWGFRWLRFRGGYIRLAGCGVGVWLAVVWRFCLWLVASSQG